MDEDLVQSAADGVRTLQLPPMASGCLRLVILPNYLDPWLESLPITDPIALVRPYGQKHWLGPILIPGRTACYRCLAKSLCETNHLPAPDDINEPERQRATLARMTRWLHEWAAGERSREGYIREFEQNSETGPRHYVRRRADCPTCGNRAPAVDFSKLRSEITGICGPVRVRRLGPLWVARSSQQIRHPNGPSPIVAGKTAPVLGRGVSRSAAVTGCMAESIERSCLYRPGGIASVRASYRDVASEAIHPQSLLLFSERQYAGREDWNRSHPAAYWIPPRFDENSPIEWTRAESFGGSASRLVPVDYCFYGGSPAFCISNSNGCAAGPTMEHAILAGLLELIERDAVAIWWYNRIPRPRPSVELAEVPELAGIEDFLRSRRRVLRLFDITPDLGIPVAAAVTARSDGRQILMGAACHPAPAVALRKAVAEACQMLIGSDAGGRAPLDDFPDAEDWLGTVSIEDEPHLADTRGKAAGPDRTPKAENDLEFCLNAIAAAGLQAWFVDLTRAELGLRVARVIVPGLRFWTPRFAPGRLYDVPVKMGWRSAPQREEELNPWPWFL